MNRQLHGLARFPELNKKMIVGLMAGTSLDGLDVALCEIQSEGLDTILEIQEYRTIDYPEQIAKRLHRVAFRQEIKQPDLSRLHRDLGDWYGASVLESLDQWDVTVEQVDLVASHGQTIFHEPRNPGTGPSTLQVGDADHIAWQTGIPTMSDFRQKFVAAGGEGAPITPHVDRLLFHSRDEQRILLNIGGIANYTWLGKRREDNNVPFSYSDTGPGNTLIDQAIREYFPHLDYDDGGKIAAKGQVNERLLNRLLQHPFMQQPPPKSTGPESFRLEWVKRLQQELNLELEPRDLIATLTRFTVESIARALEDIEEASHKKAFMYASGGGVHNNTLFHGLEKRLEGFELRPFKALGMDPDAREAGSFAVLANQSISGKGIPFESGGAVQYINPGKISPGERGTHEEN